MNSSEIRRHLLSFAREDFRKVQWTSFELLTCDCMTWYISLYRDYNYSLRDKLKSGIMREIIVMYYMIEVIWLYALPWQSNYHQPPRIYEKLNRDKEISILALFRRRGKPFYYTVILLAHLKRFSWLSSRNRAYIWGKFFRSCCNV